MGGLGFTYVWSSDNSFSMIMKLWQQKLHVSELYDENLPSNEIVLVLWLSSDPVVVLTPHSSLCSFVILSLCWFMRPRFLLRTARDEYVIHVVV